MTRVTSRAAAELMQRPCGRRRSAQLDRDLALDIVGAKSDRLGGAHARQNRDVVELVDGALEAQPFDDGAAVDVDDDEAAAGGGILVGEMPVERETGERPAMTGP